MKDEWKAALITAIATPGRFCWKGSDGQYATLSKEDFYGNEEEPGYLYYLLDLVDSFRKQAFIDGYMNKANQLIDVPFAGPHEYAELQRLGELHDASKAWDKYESKL